MTINTLGFLGAGNMAGAIIQGLLNSGFPADKMMVCDLSEEKLAVFAGQGCHTTTDGTDLFGRCDAVLLAVKPQVLKAVLEPLAMSAQTHKPLILSVVAAIGESAINRWLGGGLAIIRTMPNTPALVQAGATGLFANAQVNESHKRFAESVFSGIGQFSWVADEHLLHAVTAAAGSAPAYFFRFAEAMAIAAQEHGLDESQARTLIGQTMLGAAKMIMETDDAIGQMRQNVCSPNGTTERAIFSFNDDNIDAVVKRAMQACFDRSVELSEQLAD